MVLRVLGVAGFALGFSPGPNVHPGRDPGCLLSPSVLEGSWVSGKLTWLVLGGDPAVRSRRVEQFTAL